MNKLHHVPKKRLLTSALMMALAGPAFAQSADPLQATSTAETDATTLDTVTVTGIRASLSQSMNLKRDSQGVVDGIVAEDIGKFPDTNLAESLQRISGVSIDRVNGEGSKVTVRGIGPDFNLVLLNGRQMPASTIMDAGPSNSRAFDFANLASESISEVDVYKTSRASIPTGGIGATIDIRTARPLDTPGMRANIGVKGVWDTSDDNLPNSLQGEDVTPEVSGIFSNTYADGKFGVALSGSYQERDYGFSQVSVGNGWKTFRGDENNWGAIPQPGAPGSENITNRPDPDDVYSVPQNLNYNINGVQRQRTNGLLTLQFAPTDTLTATLDYAYSENKIQTQRNEMSVWFNFGPSVSSWTDGPVAGPNLYSEIIDAANSDAAYGGGQNATKTEGKSLAFNLEWRPSDNLNLYFDYHNSSSETGADSPLGSSGVLGTAGFFRGTTSVDFSGDLPLLNMGLPAGTTAIDASKMMVSGSSFRNSYMKSEVEQSQFGGDLYFEGGSKLDFGVGYTEVNNRSAYSNVQLDTWGGATNPGDYPDEVWQLDHMGQYFDQFSGHNDPFFTDSFFIWDFDTVRQLAEDAWVRAGNDAADYRASSEFTTDRRVTEKSKSAFAQWSNTWDWSMPFSAAVGVRYEKTSVSAEALVPTATAISWGSANELNLVLSDPQFSHLSGEYSYILPSVDLALDVTDTVKLRGSYSETIGRPGWGDIQGGQTLDSIVRVDGGTGSLGNPQLEPLLSHNFDLSLEWYYGESSYISAGFFRKNIDNYIGTTQVIDVGGSDGATPFNLHTPVGGAYWNEALASGCGTTDNVCIRNYIFDNHNGDPGVTQTGTDDTGARTGTIVGQPGDPLADFRISTPANQKSASLDGWEFNLQHVFGQSGFGFAANYTIVDSGLTYDNRIIGQQFALEGLSDSANFVGFYDKGPWQIRAAYNWRDEFLSGRFDGGGPNPNYTEPYGQLDMNVSYTFNERLTLSVEGINITDETQRIHGRNKNQVLYATQTGARYMLGLRYKF
ncbi:TonB-dependent receptor [Pseudoxanthomonas dokdonensis]|uniref:TonB-dependent receptor n=1 Tax=Pseudoxanthomonas dokdonensis TaxID=344882 RepID=A0A0R0D286_9GAMM|nr:TonB-dependent receptor [Pseudoxanthomonas dokdonensis]KRG71480.1 TonB-dependent receptor [Pseudoxanthomonas dokdonensis]